MKFLSFLTMLTVCLLSFGCEPEKINDDETLKENINSVDPAKIRRPGEQ